MLISVLSNKAVLGYNILPKQKSPRILSISESEICIGPLHHLWPVGSNVQFEEVFHHLIISNHYCLVRAQSYSEYWSWNF